MLKKTRERFESLENSLAALNVKAGTKNLGLNAVCNIIAGTTGLEALSALNQKNGT
jgi:hypothetical protein